MQAKNVINFLSHFVNHIEPQYTLRLQSIEFSPKHGHEICVMQLVGKNSFPKYTAEEIISDPKVMVGLSPQDAVYITQLDHIIKERKKKCRVLEIDCNGSIVLQDEKGRIKRYSERSISSNRELLNSMSGRDAHDLGYRVGFKDGLAVTRYMKQAKKTIKEKIRRLIPI